MRTRSSQRVFAAALEMAADPGRPAAGRNGLRAAGPGRSDPADAGGLFRVVGETGWQLSHGERSRVYKARALLQGADLVVLDESFAELDPDSLLRCLPQAADLARTLVVVAHA